MQQAGGEELAKYRTPAMIVQISADAKSGQLLMSELLNLVRGFAAQYID